MPFTSSRRPGLTMICASMVAFAACSGSPMHRSKPTAPGRQPALVTAPVTLPELRIDVQHEGGQAWQAVFRLVDLETKHLVFKRSGNLFRKERWAAADAGFEIVDHDGREVLRRRDGKPFTTVRLLFTTYSAPLLKDYALMHPYSDGSVLMYTGHFNSCPTLDLPATENEAANPRDDSAPCIRTQFTFHAPPGESIVVRGKVSSSGVSEWYDDTDDGTYVYFGRIAPVDGPRFVAVLDPGLPSWVRGRVEDMLPRFFDYYAVKLSIPLSYRPVVFFNYIPSDGEESSHGGGILDGLVQLTMEGKSSQNQTPEALEDLLRSLAHESAHLWNGRMFEDASHSVWLSEGGADAFAHRALLDLGVIDEKRFLELHTSALNRCIEGLGAISLRQSREKRRFGNYYACGAILQTLMEASVRRKRPERDLFSFWSLLLARAQKDKNRYSEALALSLLSEASGDAELSEFLSSVLSSSIEDLSRRFRAHLHRLGLTLASSERGSAYAQREAGISALIALMKEDCQGGVSIRRGKMDASIETLPRCATLKQNFTVERIGPHSLVRDGIEAYEFAKLECEKRGRVTLSGARGQLDVACKRLPTREPKLILERVAYPKTDGPGAKASAHEPQPSTSEAQQQQRQKSTNK